MPNPPYNYARGAATLITTPPFDFDHVILRVFPLRASIYRLRQFCDRYLVMDQPFHRFEPALPYVFLSIINYGRMGQRASNLGWVSQNEVAFGVPLNWYVRPHDWGGPEDDRWQLRDAASVSPFIFVDEESSLMTGREVFGWPKSLAWLTPDVDAWTRNPVSRRILFRLSTMVFPELFSGQRQEARVLLEVEQEPPVSVSQSPPDLFNAFNPLLALPRAALEAMRMGSDMMELAAGLPIRGYAGERGLESFLPRGAGDLLGQVPAANTINLKQFRDSERPNMACYQALVHAPMTISCFNSGALLGDPAMLRGDPSGGYRVKLHTYDAWPIVDALGLELESEAVRQDHTVATLRPVCPFWVDVDFQYGRGEVLCWRTARSDWTRPPAEPQPLERPSLFSFNTAEGGALDQVAGPFEFPNVTRRVLPLLADRGKLQAFVDEYLNHRQSPAGLPEPGAFAGAALDPGEGLPGAHFQVWGDYVYLAASSFEEVSSETANVGWWARRQLAFFIPVRWYRWHPEEGARGGSWKLESVALVSPYMFADSEVAATTGREVQGWPVVRAELESPRSAWMDSAGPARESSLLGVDTKVLPALNADSRMVERTLLEITGADVLAFHAEDEWRHVAHDWGDLLVSTLRQEQRTLQLLEDRRRYEYLDPAGSEVASVEDLKALALEILANQRPLNIVALKQFLDAGAADRACYQSVTLYTEEAHWLYDLREIDERLHVAIHRYPNFPIVDKLGLKVKWTDRSGAAAVDYLQPVRPFWMRLSMRADLGRELFRRAGSEEWYEEPFEGYFCRSRETDVGTDLVDRIDHARVEAESPDVVAARLVGLASSKVSDRKLRKIAAELKQRLQDEIAEPLAKQRLKEVARKWSTDRQVKLGLEEEEAYWEAVRQELRRHLQETMKQQVDELSRLLSSLIDEIGDSAGQGRARRQSLRELVLEMRGGVEGILTEAEDVEFLDRELRLLDSRLTAKLSEAREAVAEAEAELRDSEEALREAAAEMLEFVVAEREEIDGIDPEELKSSQAVLRGFEEEVGQIRARLSERRQLHDLLAEQKQKLDHLAEKREILVATIGIAEQRIGELGKEGAKFPFPRALSSTQACAAVESVEPQLALQSILSNEWAHAGRSRWRQRAEEIHAGRRATLELKPDFILRRDTIGHPLVQRRFARRHGLLRLDETYWCFERRPDDREPPLGGSPLGADGGGSQEHAPPTTPPSPGGPPPPKVPPEAAAEAPQPPPEPPPEREAPKKRTAKKKPAKK